MQSRMDAAAQMGSAPSEFDNALRAATEIATLISTIPVDGKNKVEAYSKLMEEVKNLKQNQQFFLFLKILS